ncbi:type II secretion system protein F (GspF) [Methylophilus rhizosphaerae]|uniref:Type II secretion system protein F (GspF) n=1 Tax=Methylophilus rhizosphaerae TaxID=492660 RepID=A0A1G9A4E9_9PROT|nr:type II secretion system F family protein [Methylophilus rhizosphaerae]SDK21734.1 type II secretion system protein F (GspF) [Methylophilus rhizosphaerae]
MNMLWTVTIFLMLLAAALLFYSARDSHPRHIQRRFREALQQEGIHISAKFGPLDLEETLQEILDKISRSEREEIQRLLIQAGWPGARATFIFLLLAWGLPVVLGFAAACYALLQQDAWMQVFFHLFFVFAATFVLIRRLLRWKAQKRREAISKEVIPFLHLLRMLFEAGLSMEHILLIIEKQGRDLIPNLADELQLVTKRIQTGQDRADALVEMTIPLEVPELNDTIAMLKQVTRYGGNIRESLAEYTILVEQRQISVLREYVSKLSAKMSIVMMLFLFPALMAFLAGPGFIGLANALKGVGGL